MDIKTWTGLLVEESIRMTDDKEKWGKFIHGVASPRIEDGYRTKYDHVNQSAFNIVNKTFLVFTGK